MSSDTNIEDQSGRFTMNRLLSEGIVIGSVSVLFYFSAFLFELGYCGYYGVPGYFIEIGVANILSFAFGMRSYIAIFIFLYFACSGLSKSEWVQRNAVAYVSAAKVVIHMVVVYKMYSFLGLPDEYVEPIRKSLPYVFCIIFLPVWIFRISREESIKNSFLKCSDWHNDKIDSIQAFKTMREVFVSNPVEVIALYLYFFGLSYGAGLAEAKNQESYPSLSENPNLIVLRKYGDQLVVREYDATRGIVLEGLRLIKISEKDQVELIIRNRGRIASPNIDSR